MAQHLILSVGTNPLAVYVAGRALLKATSFDSVYLLHSKETSREALALKENLKGVTGAPGAFHLKEIDDSGSPDRVTRAVEDLVGQIAAGVGKLTYSPEQIHYHFSGGTKMMTTFGWAKVRELCWGNKWTCSASYLNPRSAGGPALVVSGTTLQPPDVRACVVFTQLEEHLKLLGNLHGIGVGPTAKGGSVLAEALWKWIVGQGVNVPLDRLQNWRRDPNGWNLGKNARGKAIDLTPLDAPDAVRNAIAAIAGVEMNGATFTATTNNAVKELNKAFGCEGGGFLEVGAFNALTAALAGLPRKNYFVGREIKIHLPDTKRDTDPELDVIAVLGYQLVVISCTTDGRRAIGKLKAFEALHRARQLGGDEARAIVLSGQYENGKDGARDLENDVHDSIGSATPPLRIWGRDKWAHLQAELETYLRDEMSWS